ncbi:unnamed protein product [Prunus armeniaca]|uniref:DDE Tnp4 domain-containing protein n=1 Tax=Prunus armeniaca TaxID=36596 RepID=A0A6J5VVV4_PRUAR|nr:unnamed protein product [Prunus armeniaca]
MTLPTAQTSDDWCDLKDNYSMLLQGIVDHEMRFLDIITGWPGGMTVSRLFYSVQDFSSSVKVDSV